MRKNFLFKLELKTVAQPDFLELSETWLKKNSAKCVFKLEMYQDIFSCNRESKGGAGLYVKKGIEYNLFRNLETAHSQMLTVKTRLKRGSEKG